MIVPIVTIYKGKILLSRQGIQNLVNERKRKLVFQSGFIEFSEINKNSPFPGHFIWNHFKRGYPLTIRDGINKYDI
jgi:hypothetical protein